MSLLLYCYSNNGLRWFLALFYWCIYPVFPKPPTSLLFYLPDAFIPSSYNVALLLSYHCIPSAPYSSDLSVYSPHFPSTAMSHSCTTFSLNGLAVHSSVHYLISYLPLCLPTLLSPSYFPLISPLPLLLCPSSSIPVYHLLILLECSFPWLTLSTQHTRVSQASYSFPQQCTRGTSHWLQNTAIQTATWPCLGLCFEVLFWSCVELISRITKKNCCWRLVHVTRGKGTITCYWWKRSHGCWV